jgi:hypothetical protein
MRRAQTSFEFRKGKAFPVISGIVVATANEDTTLEVSGRSRRFFFLRFSQMAYLRRAAFKGILGGRACRGAEGTGEAPASRSQPMDKARARAAHPPADA